LNATDNGFDHHRGRAPLLGPTGRLRTSLFVALNLAGFAVANSLWHYLGTGRWVELSLAACRRDLASPLGESFLQPLSVFSHPWMILVNGLLLGAIIFVPVVVAVLYRMAMVAVFVAVAALLGHAPVLAVALAAGCFLAGRTHLRSDKPFLAALLGLAPITAYLYLFGFLGMDSTLALPMQRVVLYAPLVVALVAAVGAVALVLLLAKLTRYRPDVVWPVITAMLVAPLVIFLRQVGADELKYSLITGELAGANSLLESVTLDTWRREHHAEGLAPGALRTRLTDDLRQRQNELMDRCRRFLKDHGNSPRAPAILWLCGQAASLALDEQSLEYGAWERGEVRYSAAYGMELSHPQWKALTGQFDQAPQAALAHWRLGDLALRSMDVDDAAIHLQTARARLQQLVLGLQPSAGSGMQVFSPAESIPGGLYYEEALRNAQRLLWLVRSNNARGDKASAEALAALLRLNPYQAGYYQKLCHLAGQYENTAMGDNLKLAVAMATPNLYERAEMLIPLADDRQADSSVEANYELGQLARRTGQAPALPLIQQLLKPQEYFERVVQAAPNPFQESAAWHLVQLQTATQPDQARARGGRVP
jgi:hypothetical protein